MGHKHGKSRPSPAPAVPPAGVADITQQDYQDQLHDLQVELVKLQRHAIRHGERILVLLEGRDGAGKDGAAKRFVENLSPRDTRVVALGKPSERERASWYFQRWVPFLPAAQELVLFNRSWYNRAGVEHVMGFCSATEHEEFLQAVPRFEALLVDSGLRLLKYYLDISKDEQKRRLAERAHDPLKQWKISPIDAVAVKHWKAYSRARDAMLARTHTPQAPWRVVSTDNKLLARLNLMRDVLARLPYRGKQEALLRVDDGVLFEFTPQSLEQGRLMA